MNLSTLTLFLLPLLMAFAGTDGYEALPDKQAGDEIVYYYIDHSCACRPTAALPTGKYWILTNEIFAAKASDIDPLVAQYKRFLESQFASHKAMSHDVVIRYQQTEAMAQASRARKIEKMRSHGYTILEAAFSPEVQEEP